MPLEYWKNEQYNIAPFNQNTGCSMRYVKKVNSFFGQKNKFLKPIFFLKSGRLTFMNI